MSESNVLPKAHTKKITTLTNQISELEQRCSAAEEALNAIRHGEVDALVIETKDGEKIYTFQGAETTYRLMVESINEGAATLIEDGTILYCNSRFAEMMRIPLEAVIGKSFHEFLPVDGQAAFKALLARGLTENCRCEFYLIRNDGTPIPAMISLSNFSAAGSRGVCLIATDLTERKIAEEMASLVQLKSRAEKDLRQAQVDLENTIEDLKTEIGERTQTQEDLQITQQMLQTVVDRMPTCVCLIRGSDMRIELVNPAYQAIAPSKKMLGLTLDELWPETGQNFAAICQRVLETGEPYEAKDELNTIQRESNGPLEQAYFSWSLNRVRLPGARGWGILDTAQETTARKRAEDALIESRRKFQDLIETTSEFIWETDAVGRYTYCSPQMEIIWGLKPAQMIGKTPFDVMPPTDADRYNKLFIEISKSASPFRGLETVAYNGKGQLIHLETSGVPYFDQNGEFKGYRGITRDVTERKKADELLHQAYDELEQRVQDRTRELVTVNEDLKAEITDRERAEKQALSSAEFAEGLTQSVIALNLSLDLDYVLDTIFEQLKRSVPYTVAAITQTIDGKDQLIRYTSLESHPDSSKAIEFNHLLNNYPLQKMIHNSQQSLVIEDIAKDSNWHPTQGIEWIRSYVAAPLVYGEGFKGTIHLTSEQPGAFNQETASRLMAFAAPAALAIQNAQRYAAETRARRVAEVMSAISLEITRTLDLDTVLQSLLEHLPHLLSYYGAYIAIIENESQLKLRAKSGIFYEQNPKIAIGSTFNISNLSHIRKVITSQKSLLIRDTHDYPGWKTVLTTSEIRCWLGIPILLRGEVIGIIGLVHNQPNMYDGEQRKLIESIASQVSVAIQNAWLFEQVRTGSERLQFLARRLVEVQENKLSYVSQELHDEIGQALTSLMLGLKMLEKEAARSTKIKAAVDEMGQVLENTMENLHRLAMDLRPAVLDQLGLEAALQQLLKTAGKRFDLDIHFEMSGISERLDARMEIAFYRIVQEALNNIARHANANRVDVLIQTRRATLILIVEDDGVGFDPQIASQGDRLGIFGMRERAEMLGGKLTIESSTGKGTTVLVEVPYPSSSTQSF